MLRKINLEDSDNLAVDARALTRPITLAGRSQTRSTSAQRQHRIGKVMDLLRDWRLSPFEHEASTRHGLRQALVLDGDGWAQADGEAALLVERALRLLGAVRPTWEQGQRDYVVPRENCRWCSSPLPEEEFGGLRKGSFCDAECARSAIRYRDLKTTDGVDKTALAAIAIIKREARPSLKCQHCGTSFKPFTATCKDQRFCSHGCAQAARVYIDDRECKTCGTTFRPKQLVGRVALYCSPACHYGRKLDRRVCVLCSELFTPSHPKATFCSPTCNKYSFKIRNGAVKSINPRVFDYVFRMAA